jgi:hypothetical protein
MGSLASCAAVLFALLKALKLTPLQRINAWNYRASATMIKLNSKCDAKQK